MQQELSSEHRSDIHNRHPRSVQDVVLSTEARYYAVKELARRARVSQDFFRKWQIEVKQDRTIVSLGDGTAATIHFMHETEDVLGQIMQGIFPVARAAWLGTGYESKTPPDLILPFCTSDSDCSRSLYEKTGKDTMVCRSDLLLTFVLVLSRVEETISTARDEHDRFPASNSVASRHNFLERPILDEHGLAFERALRCLLPAWLPEPRTMRVHLTHDIDEVGIPFDLRASVGHSLKRRTPSATVRDFVSLLTSGGPTNLALVEKLANISQSRGLHSAFYWKASPRGPRDSGYDPASSKIRGVIERLRKCGFELGVHPGYNTFGNRANLLAELTVLRKTLGANVLGGRQHYLRWSPDTWLDWEHCQLSYDSSLGFADQLGFRSGTSFPYRPWCLRENREIDLVEVPLILMDCTPVKYMKLDREQGRECIRKLIERTAQVGGVFTLLWHNTPLLDPAYNGWYDSILNLLDGTPPFDTAGELARIW